MNKCALITNDVETTSLWNHRLSDKTGEKVLKDGMPKLLELYEKYDVKATFFFTAYIASKFPEVVKMVVPAGHEVASHGLVHNSDKAFDVLTPDEQYRHLSESKKILEEISGQEVTSFRAPALRVNSYTVEALTKAGYNLDSSVAPQRADMLLSFGSKQKIQWLAAPRSPYYTARNNLARKGNSSIFEIPVSSFLLPYAGTIMRISPVVNKLVRRLLHLESSVKNRPLLFLIHPNELIDEQIEVTNIERRGKTYLAYLLGDKLRYHLKLRNLGNKAVPLLEDQLKFLFRNNYEFITCKELLKRKINEAIS